MHNSIEAFLRVATLSSFIILIAVLCNRATIGQRAEETGSVPIQPPEKEKFVKATDLVAPWLGDSECIMEHVDIEPDCHEVTVADMPKHDRLTIYNSDGSIWYEFRILGLRPDYADAHTKKGLVPFTAKYWGNNAPITVILRMKSESPNWYEVEINEQTRETKFVLKNEEPRKWTRSSWSHYLYRTYNLGIDSRRTKLLDKPNGKVVKESEDINFETVKFLKADGDWALVERWVEYTRYSGWIRWRKGREILVGCIFNDNKPPKY